MKKKRFNAFVIGTFLFLAICYHIELISHPLDYQASSFSDISTKTGPSSKTDEIASTPKTDGAKATTSQSKAPATGSKSKSKGPNSSVSPTSAEPSTSSAPPSTSKQPVNTPPSSHKAEQTTAAASPISSDSSNKPTEESKASAPTNLPKGFVYLKDVLPNARFDVRYATTHNFTGKVVDGYATTHISISEEAANALKKASLAFEKKGYGFLIYDAYRPKRAVGFFMKWGKSPEDNLTKAEFYPDIEKSKLFELGYIAKRSAHSRGSAIDLTLYSLKTGALLDMGSPFDMLDPISNHGTDKITDSQIKNRNFLKDIMKSAGFKELKTEWWHYQLVNEPFPDTYFDFIVQ